ncbi:MAG TPA: hypothetical protein VFR23_25340 [Jiangellaceae bacterium]|nr:hypothetical protein [Jiangellaceae bacterium]
MSEPIEIESIARLDIKPGEVLVVRLPQPVTREVAAEIAALLAKKLPAGIETIVTSGDVRLDVVARATP